MKHPTSLPPELQPQVGDLVTIIDEFGEPFTSTIIALDAYEMQGVLGIDGTYGCYCRKREEIYNHSRANWYGVIDVQASAPESEARNA